MIHQRIDAPVLWAALFVALISLAGLTASAQSLGTAGTIIGVVNDPNNAVVPNATVTISNPVTGYSRTVTTGQDGTFRFDNIPPNNYQIIVSANGFISAKQSQVVRTS